MMKRRAIRQRTLFDSRVLVPLPSLQEEEKRAVTLLLTEWMQALAKTIDAEAKNDKDQR
jgi:hypothetical protein